MLVLVAELDACPTGDQEVAGSISVWYSNILSWRLIINYFLQSFSPFLRAPSTDSRRAAVIFWWKNVYNTGWLLRGLSLSGKSVVCKLTKLDIILFSWLGQSFGSDQDPHGLL